MVPVCLKICFSQVFLPYIQKLPEDDIKVLIGDNLAAHLSPVVTDLCQQHNITSVALNIEYDVLMVKPVWVQ